VALPHELSREQRLALVRAFARDLADRYGAAVDFAIHAPGGDSDIREYPRACDDDDADRGARWSGRNDLDRAGEQVAAEPRSADGTDAVTRDLPRGSLEAQLQHADRPNRPRNSSPMQYLRLMRPWPADDLVAYRAAVLHSHNGSR
jgi:hypothetical protein